MNLNFKIAAASLLTTVALSAQARPAVYVETRIQCDIGTDTKLVLTNDNYAGNGYKMFPFFDFAPFVTEGQIFKRTTDASGKAVDIAFELEIDLGMLFSKRDYIADYDFGISRVVHAQLTPAFPYAGATVSPVALKYFAIPTVAGEPLQTNFKVYSQNGTEHVVKAGEPESRLAFPLNNIDKGNNTNTFASTAMLLTFPEKMSGTTGKALFVNKYFYKGDYSDLVLSGHYDVPQGLPPASDLGRCEITETRTTRDI